MSQTTPKKRKIAETYNDVSGDEQGSPGIEGDAIEWQEEDLVIGPTPRKNGRVLGLFDNLSPEKPGNTSLDKGLVQHSNTTLALPEPRRAKKITKSPLKTPSFLRRQVRTVEDGGDGGTPRLLFPAMPKRGLSLLISELREIEDSYEDEGLDVLREMEANFPAVEKDSGADSSHDTAKNQPEPGVGDVEKVKWKKKGLKRSHRRVVMRPAGRKKTTDTDVKPGGQHHGEEAEGEADDSDEYINSEDEAADAEASLGRSNPATGGPDITGTKGASKVSKTHKAGGISHNFKSLKLRNSGSKGGSRFGRGRFGGRR